MTLKLMCQRKLPPTHRGAAEEEEEEKETKKEEDHLKETSKLRQLQELLLLVVVVIVLQCSHGFVELQIPYAAVNTCRGKTRASVTREPRRSYEEPFCSRGSTS